MSPPQLSHIAFSSLYFFGMSLVLPCEFVLDFLDSLESRHPLLLELVEQHLQLVVPLVVATLFFVKLLLHPVDQLGECPNLLSVGSKLHLALLTALQQLLDLPLGLRVPLLQIVQVLGLLAQHVLRIHQLQVDVDVRVA